MAYKDEYEVARLHLDAAERAELRGEFGDDARSRSYLHPPLLRALGMKRKLQLGRWFVPVVPRAAARMRRLRGTALDPFGHARVRRLERELIGEYEALVGEAPGRRSRRTPHATALRARRAARRRSAATRRSSCATSSAFAPTRGRCWASCGRSLGRG